MQIRSLSARARMDSGSDPDGFRFGGGQIRTLLRGAASSGARPNPAADGRIVLAQSRRNASLCLPFSSVRGDCAPFGMAGPTRAPAEGRGNRPCGTRQLWPARHDPPSCVKGWRGRSRSCQRPPDALARDRAALQPSVAASDLRAATRSCCVKRTRHALSVCVWNRQRRIFLCHPSPACCHFFAIAPKYLKVYPDLHRG